VKYGVGLVKDLVKSDHHDDDSATDELLSLAVVIAAKLRATSMSDERRRRFASAFRAIASRIELESVVEKSLWQAFWGITSVPKVCKADENV
jgi:hypothetical protein